MGDARVVYRSFSVLTSLLSVVVPDDHDEDHLDLQDDPNDLEDEHGRHGIWNHEDPGTVGPGSGKP